MRESVRKEAAIFGQRKPRSTAASDKQRRAVKSKKRKLWVQPGLKAGPKFLTYQDETLGGIHRALKAAFWTHYVHKAAKRKAKKGVTKDTGLKVEEQIWKWWQARKTSGKPTKPTLKYARLFCAWVRANRYEIVASQHPIVDTVTGIGTRIDFVLWDRTQYILVELKVGYNNCFDKKQGHMKRLRSIPCTLRNQCYFQLAWMDHVVKTENCFRGIPFKSVLVVLTDSLVKRAKTGKKPVEQLARELRKSKLSIAIPLPPLIRRNTQKMQNVLSKLFKRKLPEGPEVIDLT